MNDHPPEIHQQASLWAIRLSEAPLSDAQRQAFTDWLAADPRHPGALRQAQALWQGLGALSDEQKQQLAPRVAPRRTATYWRLAAAVTLTLGLGAVWLPDAQLAWRADYLAGHGVKHITLPDGSHADMDAGSAIAVSYSATERRIDLLRGNVWFTVAPTDAQEPRPFRVAANQGVTQALGTQFIVDRQAEETTVSVAQHSVSVQMGEQNLTVQEQQRVRYSATGIERLTALNPQDSADWRSGWLAFNRQPLQQVVARMNRYRSDRIIVTGAALQQRPLTGVFAIARLDDALDTISKDLGARRLSLPGVTLLY